MTLRVEELRLRPGRLYEGYGLEVTITGALVDAAVQPNNCYMSWFLDVHGAPFGGASARTRLAAQLMLPYSLRQLDGWTGARAKDEKQVLSFILGVRKLPSATVAGLLAELAAARSDRPFVLELGARGNWIQGETDWAVALVLTRPSLLLASYESAGRISAALDPRSEDGGEALVARARRSHDVSQARRLRLLARWWLLPLALSAFCWLLLLAPDTLNAALPASNLVFRRRATPLGAEARAVGLRGCDLRAALPPTPSSLAASFELGRIAEQLDALSAHARAPHASDPSAALLARAGALVGRAQPLSLVELAQLPAQLAELEARRGVVARTRGVFSFVNACWLGAIVGIAVSIGPAAYALLRPLRHVLARACLALLRHALEPAAEWAHRSGALEVAVWALPLALLVDARRAFEPDTARLVAVSAGALAAVPCFGYSGSRWGKSAVRVAGLSHERVCQLSGAWLACTLGPLALAFDSALLGYGCVVGLFACLGLSAFSCRLCVAVGFRSTEAVARVACAAALLLCAAVVARAAAPLGALGSGGARGGGLGPFSSAVSVFGSVALHLALLIAAAEGYGSGDDALSYARRNGLALGTLLLCSAAGHFGGGEPGMANCAAVFACLHGLEKWTELHYRRHWSGWLLVLLVSCCVYAASLYAHDHPEYIAAIFA